jgi:hypothetical protein
MSVEARMAEAEAEALIAAPQRKNTKRAYGPKQKEFSVGGPPSFPIAEADPVYRLGLVPNPKVRRRRFHVQWKIYSLHEGRGPQP